VPPLQKAGSWELNMKPALATLFFVSLIFSLSTWIADSVDTYYQIKYELSLDYAEGDQM
jgi:hypothetical protein